MNSEELQKINEGLSALFDDITGSMKEFGRKTYEPSFEMYKKKYQELLRSIPQHFHESGESENVLMEIGSFLPQKAYNMLETINGKKRKELKILDYNMSMVTYIIPLIDQIKDDCIDSLVDSIITQWNTKFPTGKIGKSSFDSINGGFKKGFCYITTAVCESLGKDDNCYELNLLRNYRDNYLINETSDGESIVKEYYDIAPTIVKHINKKDEKLAIYKDVWNSYLNPCVNLIEAGDKSECKEIYYKMVRDLQAKYFYS